MPIMTVSIGIIIAEFYGEYGDSWVLIMMYSTDLTENYVGFHRVITCVICVITRFCVITHVIALQRVKRYIRVI